MTQTDRELGCFLGWAENRNVFGREQKSKLVLLDRKPIRHVFLVKKNTIRDGASTALYIAYTVDTVYTILFKLLFTA